MAPLRKSINTRNEYMNTTPFILFLLIIQQILHMMKKTSYEDCHLKKTIQKASKTLYQTTLLQG